MSINSYLLGESGPMGLLVRSASSWIHSSRLCPNSPRWLCGWDTGIMSRWLVLRLSGRLILGDISRVVGRCLTR